MEMILYRVKWLSRLSNDNTKDMCVDLIAAERLSEVIEFVSDKYHVPENDIVFIEMKEKITVFTHQKSI